MASGGRGIATCAQDPGPALAPTVALARAAGARALVLGLGPGSGQAWGVLGKLWVGAFLWEPRSIANPGVARGYP